MGRIDCIIINTCHWLSRTYCDYSEVQNISLQFMSHEFPSGVLERILIGEGMHADELASEITWLCRFLPWSCVDVILSPAQACWIHVESSWWLCWTWCASHSCCFYWCRPVLLCEKCPSRCSPTAALSTRCKEPRSAWPCLNPKTNSQKWLYT